MIADADIDVLVVGLGPAGACAAAAAARGGARVIAIDRKREAGVPVQCAEFVPSMIGQEVDALANSMRQRIEGMTTFVESEPPHAKEAFRGAMIDRATFDAKLVADAVEAGATCWLGYALRGFLPDGTAELSDGCRLKARVIVGADGPRSTVGAAAGITNRELAETRQMTVPLLEPFEDTDIFISARLPGGYAWLFPKGHVANLGLGGEPSHRQHFKGLLEDLHRQLVDQGRVGKEPLGWTGGAIPVGGMLERTGVIGGATVLMAGDAAGLANPITGAGINSAVVSGRLAGQAAAAIVRGDNSAAADYAEEIEDLFGVSLARAVERRRELLAVYAEHRQPSPTDLKRAWIAFPEYWSTINESRAQPARNTA